MCPLRWDGPCQRVRSHLTLYARAGQAVEVTLPTLAWRMRGDAGYVAAVVRAGEPADGDRAEGRVREGPEVEVRFCGVPEEQAVGAVYAVSAAEVEGCLGVSEL